MNAILRTAAIASLAASLAAGPTLAQAPGIKRTMLQRIDLGDGRELVMGIAELPPGGSVGRHTHPGFETGYALAGSASLEVDGEAPRRLEPGDSYFIPAGRIHDAKVVGDSPARVLAVYVVKKGEPLATPAR